MSRRRSIPRSPSAGFSIVEVLLATIVLMVAAFGTLSAITSSGMLGESSREITQATLAAQRMIETLKASNVDLVFADFNDDPADDPLGAGTGPGPGFAVAGLEPVDGDPDGLVGQVLFPVPAGAPSVLREDHVDASFGMPMDLDADGSINGADHSGNHWILPVRVRVEWTGMSGDRFIEFDSLLGGS